MRRNLQYLNSLLLSLMTLIAIHKGGWWGLLPWGIVFGLVALIELFLPEHTDNRHDEDEALPSGILVLHLIAHYGLLSYWAVLFVQGRYQLWEALLSAMAIGFNAGASGIVIAHEMLHRKGAFWQFGAKALLAAAGNPYFIGTWGQSWITAQHGGGRVSMLFSDGRSLVKSAGHGTPRKSA